MRALKYWIPASVPVLLGWYAYSQIPLESVGRGAGGGVASITATGIKDANLCIAASGSGTTYTCSVTNNVAAALGQIFLFVPDMTNSGNVTINRNGGGAKPLLHKDGTEIASGDLVADDPWLIVDYTAQYIPLNEVLSTNPGRITSTCGTAAGTPASDKVTGYCTSDVPLFKNDGGTVFAPGIAQTCTAPAVLTAFAATGTFTCTIPVITQNSKSAAYTTVLGDAGKHILHPTADNNARDFTIDSNANVAYPIGSCITFINQINTVTIKITSDTMTLAGGTSTGDRTLAAVGVATACKIATTNWVINGSGLT